MRQSCTWIILIFSLFLCCAEFTIVVRFLLLFFGYNFLPFFSFAFYWRTEQRKSKIKKADVDDYDDNDGFEDGCCWPTFSRFFSSNLYVKKKRKEFLFSLCPNKKLLDIFKNFLFHFEFLFSLRMWVCCCCNREEERALCLHTRCASSSAFQGSKIENAIKRWRKNVWRTNSWYVRAFFVCFGQYFY